MNSVMSILMTSKYLKMSSLITFLNEVTNFTLISPKMGCLDIISKLAIPLTKKNEIKIK